ILSVGNTPEGCYGSQVSSSRTQATALLSPKARQALGAARKFRSRQRIPPQGVDGLFREVRGAAAVSLAASSAIAAVLGLVFGLASAAGLLSVVGGTLSGAIFSAVRNRSEHQSYARKRLES